MCRGRGDNFSERAQGAKTARIFRNTIIDRERDDAHGKARNNGKYSRLRRRARINTRSCRKICVMKDSVLFAPTKRRADKTPCRRKRHGDTFLTKYNGRSRFLSFGKSKVRRIFAKQMQPLQCDRVRCDVYKCARAHNVR